MLFDPPRHKKREPKKLKYKKSSDILEMKAATELNTP